MFVRKDGLTLAERYSYWCAVAFAGHLCNHDSDECAPVSPGGLFVAIAAFTLLPFLCIWGISCCGCLYEGAIPEAVRASVTQRVRFENEVNELHRCTKFTNLYGKDGLSGSLSRCKPIRPMELGGTGSQQLLRLSSAKALWG